MKNYEEKFMRKALKNAIEAYKIDEVPVGCVITRNGEIIGEGHNLKRKNQSPLCHAEIIAINNACKNINSYVLENCEMYTTLEPCLMCTGAIIESKIKTVYIGALDEKRGAFVSKIPVVKDDMLYRIKMDYYFKKTISPYILKRFFRKIRKSKKMLSL